jgi:murein DD-endopeptidase MepM/ murein hydrolase activator NlpD
MTRRPLDGARRITGDRASHAKYGVGASTDYGADSGEAIRAPFTGWVTRWWSNTGGNSVAITNDDYKFSGQHLSAYAGASSGRIQEGAVIGYVGNTGSATTGPHLHCWIIRLRDSYRLAFEEFLLSLGWKNTAGNGGSVPGPFQTSTAGNPGTPFPQNAKEKHMLVYQISGGSLSGTIWGLAPGAMFNAPDAASGVLMAKDWNPDGELISRTEGQVRTIAGLLGIPDNLVAAGMAGVNWSWSKDAAGKASASADLKPVLAAVAGVSEQVKLFVTPPSADQIATAVRTKLIKE